MNIMRYGVIAVALMAVVSCAKETASPDRTYSTVKGGTINMRISTSLSEAESATKLTFDGQKYKWDGVENLKVLVGNTSTTTTESTGQRLTLPSVSAGVFAGTLELSESFGPSDIWAVVAPGDIGPYHYYHSSKLTKRLRMPIAIQQTQELDGVMNCQYFPFYSTLSLSTAPEDGVYSIDNLEMHPAAYVIRFNVYGSPSGMADDEVLKSITVKYSDGHQAYTECNLSSSGENLVTQNNNYNTYVVTLSEEKALKGRSSGDGVKVFLTVQPQFKNLGEIDVETSGALYVLPLEKTLSPASGKSLFASDLRGDFFQFGLNLAKFKRYSKVLSYSFDEGATWVESLPADGTNVSSIAVRGAVLTEDAARAVDAFIRTQTSLVDVDFSACHEYEAASFPMIFGGETSDAANKLLRSIKLPSNVTELGEYSLRYCSSLQYADLSNIVTTGKGSLQMCTSLKEAYLPKCTALGGYTFSLGAGSETDLTSVYIPNVVTIGEYAFRNQKNLVAIDCPSATSIGQYAFSYANEKAGGKLKYLNIPKVTTIANYAFYRNESIENLSCPLVTSVGYRAFEGCKRLASIELPKATTFVISSNNSYTFRYCIALKSINLPSITSLGHLVFSGCTSLMHVTFSSPENAATGITKIGSKMFDGCASLTDFYCYSNKATVPFGTTKNVMYGAKTGGKIHVTANALAAYQAASTSWVDSVTGWTLTTDMTPPAEPEYPEVEPDGPGNMVGYNKVSDVADLISLTTPDGFPMAIAHRGCWSKEGSSFYINENSLAGIRMAKRYGYTGVECDVKYTSDKKMVLMHDASINRTMRNASDYSAISGTVNVTSTDFETLRTKYVLQSTDPAERVPIPTLEEFLLECKKYDIIPMLHSAVWESFDLAQSILGNKWIAFSGFSNIQYARIVSDCMALVDPDITTATADVTVSMLRSLGGWCGMSTMKYGILDSTFINTVKKAGFEVQASIWPAPYEWRAWHDGVTIQLSDFFWHQNVGRTPSHTETKDYASLAGNSSYTWTGTKEDCQGMIVELDFVGTIKVTMPGSRTYTITHDERGTEMLCTRLYKTAPSVTVTATAADTSVGVKTEVYSL